jgi:hypothetical protein
MLRFKEWTFESNTSHKVTAIRLYSGDDELIYIELKPVYMNPPENVTKSWEDWNHYDSICIYQTDYKKLMLPSISALFPAADPEPNGFGIQEELDLTSINFLGKEDWQKLIENLTDCMETADEDETAFYRSVIGFLKDSLAISDWFCIEGNL